MADLIGGLRDRMIAESFYQMVKNGLEDLGWLDAGRAHRQIVMQPGPTPRNEPIEYNTLVVTFEDIDDDPEQELGSNLTEFTHVGYVDFYCEPPPPEGNGGEALGKQVIGDVRALVAGEMPAIGRSEPQLDVYDYSLATPVISFVTDIDRIAVRKAHRYDQPWERYWYTVAFEITEYRP